MASVAGVLQVFVNANTKVASAQLAAFDKQLHGVGKTSAATGAGMGKFTKGAAAAGAAIGAVAVAAGVAGKQLYDLGVQFDDAYDTIRVGTGATGRELGRLKKTFRDVAKDVPSDFQDVGTAIADLNTRLGLTGKPLERMAEDLLHVSQMTGDDLQGNIKAVARSFVDWEITIPKQSRALDGLFRLSQASGASISELADSVQRFGSPLRQLGFTFEEAAAMFANFERAGVNTQTMVPGLKLAISNLTRPTDALAAQMKQLGIEAGKPDVALRQIFKLLGRQSNLSQIDKTGLAMDVFGKRAGADMAEAIKQGRFELETFLGIMRDGDTIGKAADDSYDFAENMKIFGNNVKMIVEPAASDLLTTLSEVSKVLADQPDADKKGAKIFDWLKKFYALGDKVTRLDLTGTKKALADIFGMDIYDEPKKLPFEELLKGTVTSANKALDSLKQATETEERLRDRQKVAIENVKSAQQRLNAARRRHGPNSDEAAVAEARYKLALDKSLVAKRKLNQAERTTGAVRRATKAIIGDQVAQLKVEIGQNRRLINQKDRKIKLEQSKEQPSAKKIKGLQQDIVALADKNQDKQGKVNKLVLQAANKIGPKFAGSLARMNEKTATFRTSLGQLPAPLRKFGGTAENQFKRASKSSQGFRGAIDKTKKRVNSDLRGMPPVLKTSTDTMMDIFRQKMDALGTYGKPRVSKRMGGLIKKFAKGGMVPAAVSPGEMISYGGKSMIVPGRPEPKDSVFMNLPVGAKVFTWDGQKRLLEGASETEALRKQAPHFAKGGLVRPDILGGSPKSNKLANGMVGKVHGRANKVLRSAQERSRSSSTGAGFIGPPPGMAQLGNNAWVDANTWTVASFLAKKFGLTISSNYRTPEQNAAAGGVPNSSHMRGSPSNPGAFDFVPASSALQTFAAQRVAGITENMIHDVGSGLHNHIAFFRRGGIARMLRKFNKGGWVKTGYTVFDDAGGGYAGHLQKGNGYAELGTAYPYPPYAATGKGLIARALGRSGELPDKYPLLVKINGKIKKMYKRDRGYGQGDTYHSIDIYKDSWPFFGLSGYSKGNAWIKPAKGAKFDAKTKAEREKAEKEKKRRKKIVERLGAAGFKYAGKGELGKNARSINRVNELIEIAEAKAGADFGPGGSEETEQEIKAQEKLYKDLFALQKKRVALILKAIREVRRRIAAYKRKMSGYEKVSKTGGAMPGVGPKDSPKWKDEGFKKGIGNAEKTVKSLMGSLRGLVGITGMSKARQGKFDDIFSGELGATNLTLKNLGVKGSEVGADSELASLLREQLTISQRNLAIAQAQAPIFSQFMPKFHQGGIVQGPVGAERPIMAQAGEGVFTRDQMRAMGAGNITVVIEDGAIDSNRIRVEVDGVLQDKISTVRRSTPNRRYATR